MNKSLFYDEIMKYRESEIGREALDWACDFTDEVKTYEQWTPEFCKNIYDGIIFMGTAVYANAKVNGHMDEYENFITYAKDSENWGEIADMACYILMKYEDKYNATFGKDAVYALIEVLEKYLEELEDQDKDSEN